MPRPANPTLSATLRLVEQKGPSGNQVRAVASGLGCSTPLSINNFASKDDLLLALKLQAGDLLAEGIEARRHIIPVIWPSRPRSRPPVIRAQMRRMRRRLGPRVAGGRSPGALAACNALGVGDVLWLIS